MRNTVNSRPSSAGVDALLACSSPATPVIGFCLISKALHLACHLFAHELESPSPHSSQQHGHCLSLSLSFVSRSLTTRELP
jgi:hypothetical protein